MLFLNSKRLYEQNKYYNGQFRHKYLIDSANSYAPRLYHNVMNIEISKT